jgi:hypothetical protein
MYFQSVLKLSVARVVGVDASGAVRASVGMVASPGPDPLPLLDDESADADASPRVEASGDEPPEPDAPLEPEEPLAPLPDEPEPEEPDEGLAPEEDVPPIGPTEFEPELGPDPHDAATTTKAAIPTAPRARTSWVGCRGGFTRAT